MDCVNLQFDLPPHYRLKETFRLLIMGHGDPSSDVSDTSAKFAYQTSAGFVEVSATVQVSAGGQAAATVQTSTNVEAQHLQVVLVGPGSEILAPKIFSMFGLHDRPDKFLPEGTAKRLVEKFRGTHLPVTPVMFSKLVQIVLQQLVSWQDASATWRQIVKRYGQPSDDSDLIACPTAKKLLTLGYYDLVSCGALPKQARLILKLALQADRIERLAQTDRDKLGRWLLSVPGVGPWTVDYVLGFALGEPDVVIRGDFAIPDYVSWFLIRQPMSSDQQMAELLQPFVGHRFRLVHLIMQSGVKPPRRGPRAASNRWRNRR